MVRYLGYAIDRERKSIEPANSDGQPSLRLAFLHGYDGCINDVLKTFAIDNQSMCSIKDIIFLFLEQHEEGMIDCPFLTPGNTINRL
ncbi:hypothetical protein CTI12_AA523230 [Artemisia annua]|uniref:Uncharacterized protein n=1 Tax=Artemisia annua TaxID=35608 RepID=A0A2U1L752_ARTAN|nr:hypothetical protein CTI12_AA523230 [Artemisia annua]